MSSFIQTQDPSSLLLSPEENSHGSLSIYTYINYFKAGGSLLANLLMLLLFAVGEVPFDNRVNLIE